MKKYWVEPDISKMIRDRTIREQTTTANVAYVPVPLGEPLRTPALVDYQKLLKKILKKR